MLTEIKWNHIQQIRRMYSTLHQTQQLADGSFDCEHCRFHDLGCAMLCYDLRDIVEHWDKRPKYKHRKNAEKKELGTHEE